MKLKQLEIELQGWGEFKGRYVGKVSYEGEAGSVCMTLPPEVSEVVLAAVGKQMVALTAKTATNLVSIMDESVAAARMANAQTVPELTH